MGTSTRDNTIPTPLANYYMDLLKDTSFIGGVGKIPMKAPTLSIPKQKPEPRQVGMFAERYKPITSKPSWFARLRGLRG